MKTKLATLLTLCLLLVSGCAGQDALTIQNMERFRQVWEEDRRIDLPVEKIEARNFEFDQALKYERSK